MLQMYQAYNDIHIQSMCSHLNLGNKPTLIFSHEMVQHMKLSTAEIWNISCHLWVTTSIFYLLTYLFSLFIPYVKSPHVIHQIATVSSTPPVICSCPFFFVITPMKYFDCWSLKLFFIKEQWEILFGSEDLS